MFYLFLHKIVVLRQFHFFNMASKMAIKGHVTTFIIFIDLNEGNIYMPHSVKVSKQYVEWFWRYSVLNPNALNIQDTFKHAKYCFFFRCLATKVL